MRIGDALEWYATYTPDKVAIIESGRTLTYLQLWSRACRLADALRKIGIVPGDRIALLLANSSRYLEVYQAAALLGAAVVPLNFRFVSREIEYVVNHSEAKALFFDSAFAGVVSEARRNLPSLGSNFIITDGVSGADRLGYDELVGAGEEAPPASKADPEASYFQGYTSGTTGFPKGCVNPHGRFAGQLQRIAKLYGIGSSDVTLTAAPLFHEAPALFALSQLLSGGTVVVTSDADPAHLFSLIASHRVTWAFMVPTMWASLATSDAMRGADVSSMRLLVSGGSPLLTYTKETLMRFFPRAGLNEFYGATELGLISNLGPEDQVRKVRSVGRPVFGMYVSLLDENGDPVPKGEIGEIYVSGSTLLREYFKNPEATAAARRGEWLTLGDMGRFDEEGYLHIVDRKQDMMISGGENIFPADIEDVLYRHPAVGMCAVVGAPDPRWGEVVVAAVVLRLGQTASEEELIAHCRSELASFKVPKRIEFRSELPMSAFGKILRREVRRPFWEKEAIQV